jgi:hypothetical protein
MRNETPTVYLAKHDDTAWRLTDQLTWIARYQSMNRFWNEIGQVNLEPHMTALFVKRIASRQNPASTPGQHQKGEIR